ncbi:MAG: hypothetical protein IKI64_03415 [Clostridia bacterium]|nr:hypothetical protein [Clostridia bacterium]
MKRFLSFLAIGLTAAAFILLCLIWVLKIKVWIPILMFAAAFVLLGIVKRMHAQDELESLYPSDDNSGKEDGK